MNFLIKKQQGVALVMALIMLLLITVIGVASVRMTTSDTQISGNSMYASMVFQGAESTLGKIASIDDLSNIKKAAVRSTTPITINSEYFQPAEEVTGGAKLDSSAQIIYDGSIDGALFSSIPNSTSFSYQIFRTTAESKLATTAARAVHIQGIAIQKPSQ